MRKSACDSCSARSGCGQGTLSKLLSPEASHVQAIDKLDVSVGKEVVIGIPENTVLKSSLLMYLMPLVLMLVAAMIAAGFGEILALNEDLLAASGGAMGFSIGLLIVRWYGKKHANSTDFQAVVLREQIPHAATPICFDEKAKSD